jgi:hypothetical protein
VTLTPTAASIDDSTALPAGFSPDRMAEHLAAYVANPLYRAATFDELVIDDNPYRRPVRPEDLGFLRFDEPVGRADSSRLSSLIGHRILLNIYDTGRPLLAREMTEQRWRDFQLFYGERNRVLGELVRPFLENHVFAYVHRAVDEMGESGEPRTPDALRAALEETAAARRTQADDLVRSVEASGAPAEAAKMAAVQLLATSLNAPLQVSPALLQQSLAGGAGGRPAVSADDPLERRLDELVAACGFGLQPHQYYQFYLPSTLARMNYLNAASRSPGGMFRFLGAMCGRTLESAALVGRHGSRLTELVAPGAGAEVVHPGRTGPPLDRAVDAVFDAVVGPLEAQFGAAALAQVGRGLREYSLLLDVHHDDLTTQLTFIDSAPAYREKAERLQRAIEEHRIPVELDTFVESHEECSTTHVHDDDRLLIIESGEMEFWNCFAGTHSFRPGDKMFIPKHRLHGSVVLSGECVYHQPVITAELNRQFG